MNHLPDKTTSPPATGNSNERSETEHQTTETLARDPREQAMLEEHLAKQRAAMGFT